MICARPGCHSSKIVSFYAGSPYCWTHFAIAMAGPRPWLALHIHRITDEEERAWRQHLHEARSA